MNHIHSLSHADATRRLGAASDGFATMGPPMRADDMDRLTAWFAGTIALPRWQAHQLLAMAVESGRLTQRRAEFVAAIKALAAGPASWHDMGYRLLPDD